MKKNFLLKIFFGILMGFNVFFLFYLNYENRVHKRKIENVIKYADLLKSRELYADAAAAYKNYLVNASGFISPQKEGNLYFLLADLYREHLLNYQKALSAYLKVTLLVPEGELYDETKKYIIECLDRLGRGSEAAAELADISSINENRLNEPVARIAGRLVTMKDVLEYHDVAETDEIQEALSAKNKNRYIIDYLFKRLLVRKAKRLGYAETDSFVRRLKYKKMDLLTREIYENEYFGKLKITEKELKAFYQNNKMLFVGSDGIIPSYEDCRRDVKIIYTENKIHKQKDMIFKELLADDIVELFIDLSEIPKANDHQP